MSKVTRFLNSTWEGLKISLGALGINKTRSILTTLCIIIGIVIGIQAGNGMAVWIETEPVIPIWAVTLGFFGMLIIGIVFGVYPAFKAARLDPIESLR